MLHTTLLIDLWAKVLNYSVASGNGDLELISGLKITENHNDTVIIPAWQAHHQVRLSLFPGISS